MGVIRKSVCLVNKLCIRLVFLKPNTSEDIIVPVNVCIVLQAGPRRWIR
jgi:hypothetical protein